MLKQKLSLLIKSDLGIEQIDLIDGGRFADLAIAPNQLQTLKSIEPDINELVKRLREAISTDLVESIKFESGFINFKFSLESLEAEAKAIISDIGSYQRMIPGEVVVIDYSGPNIAKPFSVGHLRSTVIGQANLNIHKALGYEAIGINHIGDWGTQFGKLIYAIKNWGNDEEIAANPIKKLNELYVRFHDEASKRSELDEEARGWSKKLEDGDPEAREIWQKCVNWSFDEFDRIYKILDIKIDNVIGESFYENMVKDVIADLENKNLLTQSEGAMVVELDDLPPALIKRQDGATLYMTRDLAAIKYRMDQFKPSELIYHVGQDQQLHFKQLEQVAKKLDYLGNAQMVFAGHGMMRLPEGKMSTRQGRVILLEDLIEEAKKRVEAMLTEKKSKFNGEAIDLAISAIKYADLSSNRRTDVVFSFDKMIDLRGNSSIYLQYAYARLSSLTSEYEKQNPVPSETNFSEDSTELLREAIKYQGILLRSAEKSEPSILADFIYNLANKFNSYYEQNRIITRTEKDSQNIQIVYLYKAMIGEGLDLLGISKFDRL